MSESNEYMDNLSDVRRGLIEDCMTVLGYPVISLFITQEQIDRLINLAVRKCSGKACPKFLQSFYVGSGVIDVSAYHMSAVSAVYSADVSGSGSGGSCDCGCSSCGGSTSNPKPSLSSCNICQQLCQYRIYSSGLLSNNYTDLYNRLAQQAAQSELRSLELSDVYLDVSEGKLYVDNYSGAVTVEYVKSSISLEDLQNDDFWLSWVTDYTIALAKITEGRIRAKYKPSSGVFEVEADELINEGNTDKQELEERLNENIGYWNILRG